MKISDWGLRGSRWPEGGGHGLTSHTHKHAHQHSHHELELRAHRAWDTLSHHPSPPVRRARVAHAACKRSLGAGAAAWPHSEGHSEVLGVRRRQGTH